MGLTGLTAARAAFRRIPAELRKQLQKHAVIPTARAVLAAARSSAPVLTGELKGSIKLRVNSSGKATVSADAKHALAIEFGTSGTRAQPFMLTAATGEEQAFVKRAHQAGKALEQVLKVK